MKQKKPWLKLIGYFILGMLTFSLSFGFAISFPLGVIIGAIWIKFKTKEFKKEKLIALILGFALAFIVPLITGSGSFGKTVSNKIMSSVPEINSVNQAITNAYPNVTVTGLFIKNYTSGENLTVAEVNYRSPEEPNEENMVGIARIVCNELDKQSSNTNKSVVLTHKKPYRLGSISVPIYTSRGLSDTCEGWKK